MRTGELLAIIQELVLSGLRVGATSGLAGKHIARPDGARGAAKGTGERRKVGGGTPPREFVLMARAAIGLGSVFTHLKAEINWHRMFHDLIDDFDEEKLAKRQKKMLGDFDIPLAD